MVASAPPPFKEVWTCYLGGVGELGNAFNMIICISFPFSHSVPAFKDLQEEMISKIADVLEEVGTILL